jgi:hypothetical protein
VSEGLLPDGSTNRVRFPGRATPGQPNASAEPDSDGDGIPDAWETRHGLNPDRAADALEDPDGDGASNRQEFLAGTDPRNASSVFRLAVGRDGAAWSLRFLAQAARAYRLEIADSVTGPWTRSQDIIPGNTAREVSVPLPWDAAQRFYRMVVP